MKNYRLPETCYAHDLETGDPVLIFNGTSTRLPFHGVHVDTANELLGVTPQQREAMLIGSHFGWDSPGCDPDLFLPDGAIDKDKYLLLIERVRMAAHL